MNNPTTFKLTGKTPAKALRGQALQVFQGLSDEPQTITAITDKIKADLVTRQDPERITAYYLCIFKKQGIVEAIRPVVEAQPETKVEAETPATEPTDTEDEDAENEDEDAENEDEDGDDE